MSPILRNLIAFVVGWFVGSILNLQIVNLSFVVYPIEGFDPSDMEALAALMPTLGFKHLIFPFAGHAIGTLVGALIAALLAKSHRMKLALGMGGFFLIGGIMMTFILPAPMVFIIADLLLAYIPMAWIGGTIAMKLRPDEE